MKYRRLKGTNDGGPICANAPDAFTLKSASKITLQPGEEKEEVLIYFEEDKWVEQYTYRYDKDIGKGVYGDLVYGDDISYDNIYFQLHLCTKVIIKTRTEATLRRLRVLLNWI